MAQDVVVGGRWCEQGSSCASKCVCNYLVETEDAWACVHRRSKKDGVANLFHIPREGRGHGEDHRLDRTISCASVKRSSLPKIR